MTVVLQRENDDGRPTVVIRSSESDRIFSVLGSKINTVQDALGVLEGIFEEEDSFG